MATPVAHPAQSIVRLNVSVVVAASIVIRNVCAVLPQYACISLSPDELKVVLANPVLTVLYVYCTSSPRNTHRRQYIFSRVCSVV